ncbi:(2Fe-2S)-binding protein [Glaciecola sp. 1036]|uniref:(2Fe-2S)-binding protein n=1 Tax=Alteromonadaceae TaxID=72275 RepID=UPI003D050455
MDWLDSLYTQEKQLTPEQINGLLEHQADEAFRLGKLVCSCHGVREKTITDAINQGVETVAGLGKALKCGTNCGSCKSELASLIKYTSAKTPLASTKETENESVI